MPTVKYATDSQVRGAILRWGGNVAAAADELGIQPKNLRKRLETLGLDLAAIRQARGHVGASGTSGPAPTGPRRVSTGRGGPVVLGGAIGRESASGPSSSSAAAPIFRDMQPATDEQDTSPIKTVAAQRKPLRLRSVHQERLRDAKFDLVSRFRIETDENLILEQFFEESFETWLKAKLSEKKK